MTVPLTWEEVEHLPIPGQVTISEIDACIWVAFERPGSHLRLSRTYASRNTGTQLRRRYEGTRLRVNGVEHHIQINLFKTKTGRYDVYITAVPTSEEK